MTTLVKFAYKLVFRLSLVGVISSPAGVRTIVRTIVWKMARLYHRRTLIISSIAY